MKFKSENIKMHWCSLVIFLFFAGGMFSSSGFTWPVVDGMAISTAQNNQTNPMLIPDGAGGTIITWEDYRNTTGNPGQGIDIYAQRVAIVLNTSGDTTFLQETTLWALGGIAICTATGNQNIVRLIQDGQGGAIITWQDSRSGIDIYAQRVDAAGNVLWPVNGVAICTAGVSQTSPQVVADGQGGALIVWEDYRSGNADIYAQRVDALLAGR